MAEEAIDKFKEIVGRVKFFDTASDYPYVESSVFWPHFFCCIFCCVMLMFRYYTLLLNTVFLTHSDRMVAACCFHVRNTVIVTGGMLLWEGQGSWCNHHSALGPSWQHGGSMLWTVRFQEHWHLSVLCRGWLGNRKGIQPVKFCNSNSQVYFWGLA